MDISKLPIEKLKSLAYDQKVVIENAQRNLLIIEDQINKITQESDQAATTAQSPKEDLGSDHPTGDVAQPGDA